MRTAITILLTLVLSTNHLLGQFESFSSTLLQFEKRIYLAEKSSRDLIILEKIEYLLQSDSIKGQLLSEVRRINYSTLPDSLRDDALWNASLISYLNSDLELSYFYWSKYNLLTEDTCVQSRILGYLSSLHRDEKVNRMLFETLVSQSSLFIEFDQEIDRSVKVKGGVFKKVSAFLVPGSGLIMNGNVGKGLLSMGINTGTVLLIRYLIVNNAWVNTVLWGSNLIGKFYLGGYRLTDKEIENKENTKMKKRADKSALILEKILSDYPLTLVY